MPKQNKTQKNVKRRRLFFDIETSPNLALIWRSGYKITVLPHSIINERAIVCIGWKWEGNKTVHCKTWDKDQSDKKLLDDFIKIMSQADELVTHNGDRFDIKWIRTRCLYHSIPMAPDFTSLDTFQAAKNKFLFNSNQLNYIARFLKVGEKTLTSYDLWKDITVSNDRKALKTIAEYCKNDVVMLESVFERMKPYLPPKTNFAKYIHECPECGGPTTITKRRTTAKGYKQIQFKCKECGKYSSVAASRYEKQGKIK